MATTETILEATIKAGVEHFGGFPSGTMIAFAGKSVPDGWLLCNGALVSRMTYAKLFAAIGTAWGAGDGSTTFKLPDADGRVLQGVTDASKVGKYLGSALPNITGTIDVIDAYFLSATGAFQQGEVISRATGANIVANNRCSVSLDSSRINSIYSGNELQPKALQTLIIIKV